MKLQTVYRAIRMDEMLAAHCATAAAKAHLPFSKWARMVLRKAVGMKK